MTTEEALALLELEWPRSNKLSCPQRSDSSPSLHLYEGDKGYYCFTCNKGGDGIGLLSHWTGRPIAELLTEHGITLGPRGRSRWQQIDDLEARALAASWPFTLAMRQRYGCAGFQYIAAAAERVEYLWPELFRVDEETAPAVYHATVREVERFYEGELARYTSDPLVTPGRERIQGSELRRTPEPDGRPGGGRLRVGLSRPDRSLRMEQALGVDESHERLHQAPARQVPTH